MDGTLLNSESQLSAKTEEGLNTLIDKGMDFTVATMRAIESITPIFRNVPLSIPIIELNGAFITELSSQKRRIVNTYRERH